MESNFHRKADEPIGEPGILTTSRIEPTYAPGISPEKCKDTITGGESNVTYIIKTHYKELDNIREYLSYKKEGDTNTHTKPKNRRNKVKRKHR